MSGDSSTGHPATLLWRVGQVLVVAAVLNAAWQLFSHVPYRIDVDVYRLGGQAWLQHHPLYADGTSFHTQGGLDLPFTYPPLSAIVFGPLALVSLPTASLAITVTTLLALAVSVWIVLGVLHLTGSRRPWLTAGIVAVAAVTLEPIEANFSFGQINAVLMTLVISDCLLARTPWPRGTLLGLAIALKLTPAVFLVYFALRRDGRAALTAMVSFAGASALGFALAWHDSLEYWTHTIRQTDRIGTATLNTNQNISGALARLGLSHTPQFMLWASACVAVLGLTIWSGRRILAADEPALALICVALFGLMVSPVSWSHHWVWALPTIVALAVVAYQRRNAALAALAGAGGALMVWPPLYLLPEHHEDTASWWRQLFGMSYVWWAVAVIVVAGLTVTTPSATPRRSPGSVPAADSTIRGPLPGRPA